MSHDARGMLEVNDELLRPAARQSRETVPLVVSAATWGRGCRQEVLQALEPYRHAFGFNSSIVATPPREVAARLFEMPELQGAQAPAAGQFQAIGLAYGKVHSEWRALEDEDEGDLF